MIDIKTKFISVSMYTVTAEKLGALIDAVRITMEQEVPSLDGFREGVVMTDEERTQVLIVTQWDSKNAWVRAQWEPRIGKAVAAFAENATTYDVRTFIPATIVRAETGTA